MKPDLSIVLLSRQKMLSQIEPVVAYPMVLLG